MVNGLKSGEVSLVKHLYLLKESPEKKKRDRLFNLILNHKVTTDEEAAIALYGEKPTSAYSQLKARLKSDIHNVLILQDSSVKYKTPAAQGAFDCRRALIQGEILLGRGVYGEAVNMLLKASRTAQKYELFAEKIQIDDLLRSHLVLKEGQKPFDEYTETIDDNVTLLKESLKAKRDHYLITIPNLFRTNNEHEYLEQGEEILSQIKADLSDTRSVRAEFYNRLTAVHYYSRQKNFAVAMNQAKILEALVEKNGMVKSDANIAGVSMEIANILINLGKFQSASRYAQKSLMHFKKGMVNELYAMESLFFSYFRGGNIISAQDIIEQASRHKQLKYNKFLEAKWKFLSSATEFKNGNLDASLKSLSQNSMLASDKSGWLLGVYILEIINRIEKGDYDWVEYRFEAFKKVIQRHNGKAGANRRCSGIQKVLKTLTKYDYCFDTTARKESNVLNLLERGRDPYYWNPVGYEIVRFDSWLNSKLLRQLSFNFAQS